MQVCNGASMLCSFGTAPASLIVIRPTMLAGTLPLANIMDYKPTVNVLPFAMCTTVSNPAVASATSAASGVLTPVTCVPATAAPWAVGKPNVLIDNMPALDINSKLLCSYGGVISVVFPGQLQVIV